MLRKGRLARIAKLGGLAAGLVGDAAGAAAHLITEKTEEAEERLHRHAAERMMKVLGDMKGLPLKAGQMLSYIDEMLPPEQRHIYNEMLGKLQMHTPAMDWVDVEDIFIEEYDGNTPLELFREFNPDPIAAASIGQVYHAVLHDGSEVAVKVQYPGVNEAIQSDLDNVESLVSAMSHLIPKVDFTHFVEDIISRIKEECNYELEAHNQRDFYYSWSGDNEVVIPKIYEELCRPRVLVSEFLHAPEWSEMLETADEKLKSHYGEVIFRFVFQSLYCYGMFNGDPHPGNYMFYPDGRVAFIDFGCVQRYPSAQAEAFVELRDALLGGLKGPEFRALIHKVFGLPDDIDEEVLALLDDYMLLTFEPVLAEQPFKFTRDYTKKLLVKGMDAKMVMTKKMLKGKNINVFDSEHRGVAFLGRINFGLGSILTTLGTEADFREILRNIEA